MPNVLKSLDLARMREAYRVLLSDLAPSTSGVALQLAHEGLVEARVQTAILASQTVEQVELECDKWAIARLNEYYQYSGSCKWPRTEVFAWLFSRARQIVEPDGEVVGLRFNDGRLERVEWGFCNAPLYEELKHHPVLPRSSLVWPNISQYYGRPQDDDDFSSS